MSKIKYAKGTSKRCRKNELILNQLMKLNSTRSNLETTLMNSFMTRYKFQNNKLNQRLERLQ